MSAVRTVIVDDSRTMQHLIGSVLSEDPEIEVVGLASNAAEARQAIKQLNPDVITLDVEMPDMNGIEFLEKVMRLRPMPVIMVSALTAKGTSIAIEAMEIGAVDCVAKPTVDNPGSFGELPAKIKQAAKIKPRASGMSAQPPRAIPADAASTSFSPTDKIVAIGSSTGGVEALINVVTKFPKNCAPTVITQHMPAHFTQSFAQRLNKLSAPEVCEARDGAPLRPGHVYLAPGGGTHLEIIGQEHFGCRLKAGEAVNGHRPSVDVLFNSVAKYAGPRAIGVILTGMGRDGAAGLLEMRKRGAQTIGQDEATSVVYGMPKAAFELGAIEHQLPLGRIGSEIVALTAARYS